MKLIKFVDSEELEEILKYFKDKDYIWETGYARIKPKKQSRVSFDGYLSINSETKILGYVIDARDYSGEDDIMSLHYYKATHQNPVEEIRSIWNSTTTDKIKIEKKTKFDLNTEEGWKQLATSILNTEGVQVTSITQDLGCKQFYTGSIKPVQNIVITFVNNGKHIKI